MDCFVDDFEEYDEDVADHRGGDQLDRILVPKLPVATFDDYDPSRPPTSGEEYLRRVQLEAQKCPDFVVSDMDLSKFKSNQTMVIEDSNGFVRAKPEWMPSLEWQREQVSEFSKVRLKLSRVSAERLSAGLSAAADRPTASHRSMSWWREYCIGKRSDNDSDSDTDSVCEEESDVSSTPTDTPDSSTTALKREKRTKLEPKLPLLSTVCALTHEEVVVLLSFFIKWCRQYRFTEHSGLWIYALLVALEKPLPAEVYSTLRDLSRVCSECRQRIKSPNDSKTLVPLNLIICIIGRYFDQNDLCDQ